MMEVTRMRRGWRVRMTDNEMELLRKIVSRGLMDFGNDEVVEALPYKERKVFETERWKERDPLAADEDRRAADA